MSLCQLIFETFCHLLVELENWAYWAVKTLNFNLKSTSAKRLLQLNELDEIHRESYENAHIYKKKGTSMA